MTRSYSVRTFNLRLDDDQVTVAQALKPHGYACASIGKWHLGGKPYLPENNGFDLNFGGTESGMAEATSTPSGARTRRSWPEPGEYLADRLTAGPRRSSRRTRTGRSSSISPTMPCTSPIEGKEAA